MMQERSRSGRGSDLWVFGYGSLMWNPGFDHDEARPALLRGYHRRFCTWSTTYRGSPERPGLVLGLDRNDTCRGMAFRVGPGDRRGALAYLFERELDNGVYEPRLVPVSVEGERVSALAFVVDTVHDCYTGRLPLETIVHALAHGVGRRGTARDYLANTVARLAALGMPDERLDRVLALVDARRAP